MRLSGSSLSTKQKAKFLRAKFFSLISKEFLKIMVLLLDLDFTINFHLSLIWKEMICSMLPVFQTTWLIHLFSTSIISESALKCFLNKLMSSSRTVFLKQEQIKQKEKFLKLSPNCTQKLMHFLIQMLHLFPLLTLRKQRALLLKTWALLRE